MTAQTIPIAIQKFFWYVIVQAILDAVLIAGIFLAIAIK
jgi:hypothetical protein